MTLSDWVELTSRTDRSKVWVNLDAANSVSKETPGSRISLQGRDRDLFVIESPELVMAKRREVNPQRGSTS